MFLRNYFFYTAGIAFLALAKAKNVIKGYSTPKPYDISATQKCVDYDIRVVEEWLSHLRKYSPDSSFAGKNVLELGPGSDLGIGIYLLSKGCAKYNACDVHDIMKSTPESFYDGFFKTLEGMRSKADIGVSQKTVDGCKSREAVTAQLRCTPGLRYPFSFREEYHRPGLQPGGFRAFRRYRRHG